MSEARTLESTARRQRSQRVAGGLLTAMTLLGLLCGAGYGYSRREGSTSRFGRFERVYETSAEVLITRQPPVAGAEPPPAADEADEVPQTHALLLRSSKVIALAVEKFRLHELTSFQSVQPQNVVAAIQAELTVEVLSGKKDAEPTLLGIRYRSTNVVDAMTVVKAVIRGYQDTLADWYQETNDRSVRLITEARDELGAELKKQRDHLKKFTKELPSRATLAADDPQHPETRLRAARQEHDRLDLRRVELQALLTTAEEAQRQGKLPAVIGQMLRRNELFREPAAPAAKTPEPDAKPTEATEKSPLPPYTLDDDKSVAAMLERLRLELTLLDKQRSALAELMREADRELAYLEDFQRQKRLMEDEVAGTQTMYQTIVERLKQVDLIAETQTTKIEVVSPPDQAWEYQPGWPPLPTSWMVTGAALGFLLGVICVAMYLTLVPLNE